MEAVEYDSIEKYVESATTLEARIERVQLIISAMEIQALASPGTSGKFEEYSLDTGQTKVRTKYRNPQELQAAILAWDGLLQKLIARLNNQRTGRVVQLRDHKNFN